MGNGMALTDGDRDWLQGRFDSHTEKLDSFKQDFNDHRIEDKGVAAALSAHVEACEATKRRSRRTWVFWTGLAIAIGAPIIATIVEHWLFAKHISEKLSK